MVNRLDGTSLFTTMNSGLNNTFSVLSNAFSDGVTLQNLVDIKDVKIQMSLFDYQVHEEESATKLLINDLNRKLKKKALMRASEVEKDDGHK